MTIKARVRNPEFQRVFTMWTSSLAFIISLATLGGFVFKGGAWMATTDQRLKGIEHSVTDHYSSTELHMPMGAKLATFVTRTEYERSLVTRDQQLKEIKATSTRTEDKVEKIYDLLIKK